MLKDYKDNNINLEDLVDIFYPVGSYYITQNKNFDPNIEWGGNWVKLTDCFLRAVDDPQDELIGSDEITLTVEQLPKHNHIGGEKVVHDAASGKYGEIKDGNSSYPLARWGVGETTMYDLYYTSSTGSGSPISIIPKYKGVIVYYRTA